MERPPDRSLAAKSQTHLPDGLLSESGHLCEAGRAHGYGRGLVLGDMRSIAPIMLVLVGRSLAAIGLGWERPNDCFGSLASWRPMERNAVERVCVCLAQRNGVERRQSWRVCRRARAEQCGHLARSEPMGAWEREASGERSASDRSVKPGCCRC